MRRSGGSESAFAPGQRAVGEAKLSRLWPDLSAGLVMGVMAVTVSTAFAALVFSGELGQSVSKGIALMLVASIVVAILTAQFSSLRGVVARLQDNAVAVLASVSAAIVSQMPASATAEQKFITVVVAIALSSLLTGALFLFLGQLKLGNLIRFIPYSVMGGFLAGAALLLTFGAISLLSGAGVSGYSVLYQMGQIPRWAKLLPGLVFAILLMGTMRRRGHALVIPIFLLVGIFGFYMFLVATGTSVAKAAEQGWLLGGSAVNVGSFLQLPRLAEVGQVDWAVIGQQAGSLVFIALASTVAILLNATGIELQTGQDVDLNQDLKAAGVANLVSGLAGGMVGYHSVSQTVLAYEMGARNRSIGLALALLCGIVLLLGGQLLLYIPTFVLGGLLLFLGLSILVNWVYDAWFRMPVAEYLAMIVIMIAINIVGILQGIALGFVLGAILFVVDYSRINVVRHSLSGNTFHSNVNRPVQHQELLREQGDRLYILELQGFIFFGTAQKLLDLIRKRINDTRSKPLRFLLFDFRLVNGIDSTALLGFQRITQLIRAQGITEVLTDLSTKLRREMNALTESSTTLQVFPDLDHGVEWCEDQIIGGLQDNVPNAKQTSLMKQLEEALPPSAGFSPLSYFEERKAEKGENVITQGIEPGGLYFIEKGQVTVELKDVNGSITRLRTMQTGTVVGELGFYLGRTATASVVANEPCTYFFLSAAKLKQMEKQSPETAAAFHKFIIRMLSERLIDTNATLQALMS